MEHISQIQDICTATRKEIEEKIGLNTSALILYGSYAMQEMDSKPSFYKKLAGKGGFLDKKPDYIAVVPSLEEAISKVSTHYSWSEKDKRKLINLGEDSPMIFNLSTKESFGIEGHENSKIPFKIYILSEDSFRKSFGFSNHDIFLTSRLSKFVNVLSVSPSLEYSLKIGLFETRKFFTNFALYMLPEKITGEDFMKQYMKTTYMCEAYRIFDISKKTPQKILEGKVYDFTEKKTYLYREKMEQIIRKTLENKTYSQDYKENMYDSTYWNILSENKKKMLGELLKYNVSSLKTVLTKTLVTNSIGGDNSFVYVLRKFRP